MAAKSLGSLTIDLMMEIGGFQKGADAAERKLSDTAQKLKDKLDKLERDVGKDFGKKLGQNVGKNLASEIDKNAGRGLDKALGKAFGGMASGAGAAIKAITAVAATGAAALTAAVGSAVSSGIQWGDQIDEMAARFEINAERLQELSFAGRMNGVELEDIGTSVAKLSKAMSESLEPGSKYEDLFKKLGLSVKDSQGNLKSADQFLLEIADKFKQFDDPVNEARLAMEIFGKSGVKFLEFLNRGSDGLNDYSEKARELGLVMSEETSQAMASFKDQIDTTKMQVTIFGAELIEKFIPSINEVLIKFGKWITDSATLDTAVNTIKATVNFFSETISAAVDWLVSFNEKTQAGEKLVGLFNLSTEVFNNTLGNTATRFGDVDSSASTFNTTIDIMIKALAFLEGAFATVKLILEAVVTTIAYFITRLSDAVSTVYALAGALKNLDFDAAGAAISRFASNAKADLQAAGESLEDSAGRAAASYKKAGEHMSKSSADMAKNVSDVDKKLKSLPTTSVLGELGSKKPLAQAIAGFKPKVIKFEPKPSGQKIDPSVFSGPDKGGKKSGGGGGGSKSSAPKLNDEQKAAEKLTQTYDNLVAGMDKKIYMLGKEGQAAELSYDTQFGSLKDLTQAQKDNLLAKAQQLEAGEAAQEQAKEAQKAADEAKKKEEEEIKRAQEITESLEFQLTLLGKTAEEQERLNLLRDLGSQANTQYGATALAALDNLQKASKAMEMQIEIADEVRSSFSGAFQDWISGTKSFKDAFLGALESINARILQMIADNLMAKLFGPPGTPLGGSAGGGIGGIFGSMFGGGGSSGGGGGFFSWLGGLFGRAAGGPVNAGGMYRVNETGPEMLSISGKDFLLMGNQGGTISSSNRRMGGGQVNNFVIQGRIDRRTQEQIAADVGRKSAQAQRRNY